MEKYIEEKVNESKFTRLLRETSRSKMLYPAMEAQLWLCVGARVMCTSNAVWSDAGIVNGTFGTVTDICFLNDNVPPASPDVLFIKWDAPPPSPGRRPGQTPWSSSAALSR